jgi:hypothetical protein
MQLGKIQQDVEFAEPAFLVSSLIPPTNLN